MAKKSLAKILASFDRTLNELDQLKVSNEKEVDFKTNQLQSIQTQISALESETKEAAKVADNLRKLIGR